MSTVIELKQSSTPAKVPLTSDLQPGELAVNTYDGKLFLKKDNGTQTVIEVGAAEYLSGLRDVSCAAPDVPTDGSLLAFDPLVSTWKPTNNVNNQLIDGGNF
jgi:hypothetical protein